MLGRDQDTECYMKRQNLKGNAVRLCWCQIKEGGKTPSTEMSEGHREKQSSRDIRNWQNAKDWSVPRAPG